MPSQPLIFLLSFTVFASAAFLSYNEVSLLLDPYNVVWRRREVPRAAWATEQFRSAKIEHLAAHPDIYDTLIFANSRGWAGNIREVDRVTHSRLFSLHASVDTPIGFLPKARWAVRTQTKLRRVILLLTLYQFQTPQLGDLLLYHEHPYVTGESWISYYWTFSNLPYQTFLTSARYYIDRFLALPTNPAMIVNNGFDEETGEETLWGQSYIEFAPTDEDRAQFQALVAADPPGRLRFHNSTLESADLMTLVKESYNRPIREDQLRSFIELLKVLHTNNIQVDCIVMPLSVAGLRLAPLELYLEWMQLVVQQCGAAWDFSLPGPITTDNYNYWDINHFLPHVWKLMLVRVLGEYLPELKTYSEFGVHVSTGDFETHRARWKRSIDVPVTVHLR